MWGTIVSSVSSIATGVLKNRQIKAEAKARVQVARVEAEIAQIENAAKNVADYDIAALKETRYSWKDEVALLVVISPFIGSFLPWTQDYVAIGWQHLTEPAPDWYGWIFCGAIAGSLGIRWAVTGWSGKKK
jgi:hypothetical protein